MGQFKPMVKMETTEPSVELKLKKGGSVSSPKKMMNGGVMGALSAAPAPGARGGMSPVARPGKPSMMDRRKAMMGKSAMARPMMAKGGAMDALEAHAAKPASKGHKGLKAGGMACATGGVAKSPKPGNYATGGVVNGQGGFKKGGAISKSGIIPVSASEKGAKGYVSTKMETAKVNHNSAPTGEVKMGNAGGYKKGGATKKHYATGGAVNDSGRAVAMPKKQASNPVSNDRQSGTFKRGGSVTPAEKKEQSFFKAENATAMKQAKAYSNEKYGRKMNAGGAASEKEQKLIDKAYADSIGPSAEDLDMAKSIRSIPGKLFRGAKNLMGMDKKPKAGAVTETEKSITVEPARKRGGSVNC
jgi:hypothetical protein